MWTIPMSAPQTDLSAVFDKWAEASQETFEDYQFPAPQLARLLFDKLVNQNFDAGKYFAIDNQGDPTLIYVSQDHNNVMKAASNVFLSDHCWCPEPGNLYKEWKSMPELRERLHDYMGYASHPPAVLTLEERLQKCNGKNLELDELSLESISQLNLPARFPQLESLSLWGNPIKNSQELIATVSALTNLKALWLNGTPFEDCPSILTACPHLEILNSKFTMNWGEWALLFVAHSSDPSNVAYLDLSARDITSINEKAFQRFTNLAFADFSSNQVDISHITSIIPSLRSIRCDGNAPAGLVFINGTDPSTGDISITVPERIWDHLQPIGERWGLGDEVALSIHNSLNPTVATMPAISPVDGKSYFVFWPVVDITPMTEITADLYPLVPLGGTAPLTPKPLTPMISLSSKFVSTVTRKRPIKVFTDIECFAENLHSKIFEVVKTPEEADLQWIGLHMMSDFKPYYDNKIMFNQIEGETCLTTKNNLYNTVSEYMGQVPWLPETHVLTDPEGFASFIQRNRDLKESSQSHAWVVKAFDTSRASLMIVTDSEGEVLRHSVIGPRLAQRYLWNNLTIWGKKFDLRFIVLLKSVKPMELFAYKVFWPRLAPKEWALDDFDDYERHFTVMNYRAPTKVTQKTWVDFVAQFEVENPKWKWNDVVHRMYGAIGEMFKCGCQKMVSTPLTKAMYGIDMMLTRDMQPIVLECNFQPDCHRACNLCPTFVDDVFEVLYVDQPVTNDKVEQIPL